MRYARPESLGQYMFNQPQRAKRLYFDVIPKAVDEYIANALKGHAQGPQEQPANPAWHIPAGRIPQDAHSPPTFALLLNLASVLNGDSPGILPALIPLLRCRQNP